MYAVRIRHRIVLFATTRRRPPSCSLLNNEAVYAQAATVASDTRTSPSRDPFPFTEITSFRVTCNQIPSHRFKCIVSHESRLYAPLRLSTMQYSPSSSTHENCQSDTDPIHPTQFFSGQWSILQSQSQSPLRSPVAFPQLLNATSPFQDASKHGRCSTC